MHNADLLVFLGFPLVAENLHDNRTDQYAFNRTDHFDPEEVMKVPQILHVKRCRQLVHAINRAPVNEATAEATLQLWAAAENENIGAVRDLVVEALERASYPVRQIEIEPRSEETSEVVATLIATSGERGELDAVCTALERSPLVTFASWGARSGETG